MIAIPESGEGDERGKFKRRLPYILIVATVVVVLVLYAWTQHPLAQPTTPQPKNPLEANVTNNKLGLQLVLALNTTKLESDQGLNITVEERNILQTETNVTAARSWALKNPTLTNCGLLDSPFGIEVLSGYYTVSNLSLGQPLIIFDPETIYCPSAPLVAYYRFEPLSDNVSIVPVGILPNQTSPYRFYPPFPDFSSVTVDGFWPSTAIGIQYSTPPTPFAPGEYTVAAGDEWGQLLLLYFTV